MSMFSFSKKQNISLENVTNTIKKKKNFCLGILNVNQCRNYF